MRSNSIEKTPVKHGSNGHDNDRLPRSLAPSTCQIYKPTIFTNPMNDTQRQPENSLLMNQNKETVIYEDEQIRVLFWKGSSDRVVITFGDLISLAKDTRYFADTPLKKLVYPRLASWQNEEIGSLRRACISPKKLQSPSSMTTKTM